jgi:hypothetical protein
LKLFNAKFATWIHSLVQSNTWIYPIIFSLFFSLFWAHKEVILLSYYIPSAWVWKGKFVCSRRVWVSINIVDKLSFTRQTLGAKTHKKCCHVDVLKGVVLWPLASSMKTERTNFFSPPITLLELSVCSTDGCSVKCPLFGWMWKFSCPLNYELPLVGDKPYWMDSFSVEFNPKRTFRPKMGRRLFLMFQIFLFYEFVHHETFFRGR